MLEHSPAWKTEQKEEDAPSAAYLLMVGPDNYKKRRQSVEAAKRVESSEGLEDIRSGIGTVLHGDLMRMAVSGQLEVRLTDLWGKASRLQTALDTRDVISGYKTDALDQIGRLEELLMELGLDPDEKQLAGVGYACDLAQEKIKKCLHMANLAAKVEMMSPTAAQETA